MASVKKGNGSTEVQTDFNFILIPMINYCTSWRLCQVFLFHHSIESDFGMEKHIKTAHDRRVDKRYIVAFSTY